MEYPAPVSVSLIFLLSLHPLSALVFTTPHEIGEGRLIRTFRFHPSFAALLFYYEEQLLMVLDLVFSDCQGEAIAEYVQLCQPRVVELQLLPLQQFKGNVPTDVSG